MSDACSCSCHAEIDTLRRALQPFSDAANPHSKRRGPLSLIKVEHRHLLRAREALQDKGHTMHPSLENKESPVTPNRDAQIDMAASVREELLRSLDAPVTIASLTRIEQIAGAARKLLQAAQGHDPHAMRRHGGGALLASTVNALGYDAPIPGIYGASPSASVPPYNQNETFGQTAMRELQTMLKKITSRTRDREAVIRELGLARKHGLGDVAAELKRELDDLSKVDERLSGDREGVATAIVDEVERDPAAMPGINAYTQTAPVGAPPQESP